MIAQIAPLVDIRRARVVAELAAAAVRPCSKCGTPIELSAAQIRNRSYICRPCNAAKAKRVRATHPEKSRAQEREWKRRQGERALEQARGWKRKNRERLLEYHRAYATNHPGWATEQGRRWRANHRERIRLVSRVAYHVRKAIRSGHLVRASSCEQCGVSDVKIQAAHHDYSRPLDVRWLCQRCHSRWDYETPKTKFLEDSQS